MTKPIKAVKVKAVKGDKLWIKAWAVIYAGRYFLASPQATIYISRKHAQEEANARGFDVIPVLISPIKPKRKKV